VDRIVDAFEAGAWSCRRGGADLVVLLAVRLSSRSPIALGEIAKRLLPYVMR